MSSSSPFGQDPINQAPISQDPINQAAISQAAIGQTPTGAGSRHRAIIAALLVVHLALTLLLARLTPWTPDEITYLLAGHSIRLGTDWDSVVTFLHGPLPFYANQLAALTGVPVQPYADYLLAGRIGMVGFTMLGAWSVSRLAGAVFGRTAAVFALTLYVSCPLILAHGCLMTTDMALVPFYVLAVHATHRLLVGPSIMRVAQLGVLLGIALATKYLALFLIPVVALAILLEFLRGFRMRLWFARRSPGLGAAIADLSLAAALCAALAWAVLWACYGWAPTGYDIAAQTPMSQAFGRISAIPGIPALLGLLPAPWMRGIDYMQSYAESGGESYVLGRLAAGHWHYYLVGFGVKLPLLFLALSALGLVGRWPRFGTVGTVGAAPRWPARLPLLGATAVLLPLGYLSLFQVNQVGVRHALMLVPLLCILASRTLATIHARGRGGRRVVAVCLLVLVGGAARAWPDFLTDFNSLASDRPYLWFRDSTLSWRAGFVDTDDATLRRRHSTAVRIYAGSGPRFGVVYALGGELCPSGADGFSRHWLRRFPPLDHEGAWYAFAIDDRAFELAIAATDGADRARVEAEYAAALVDNGRFDEALARIGPTPGPLGSAVRDYVALSRAGQQDTPAFAAALNRLGRHDRLRQMATAPVHLRVIAHAVTGDAAGARDLLFELRRARALTVEEKLYLAAAHYGLKEIPEGLALLDDLGPNPGAAIQRQADGLRRQLEQAAMIMRRAARGIPRRDLKPR